MRTLFTLIVLLATMLVGCAMEVDGNELQSTPQALTYTTTWDGIGSSAHARDALHCVTSALHQHASTCSGGAGTTSEANCNTYVNLINWGSHLDGATSNPANENGYYEGDGYMKTGLVPFETHFYWTQAPRYNAATGNTVLWQALYSFPNSGGTGGCTFIRRSNGQTVATFSGTF